MAATRNYILRSVYISPEVDDELRMRAFKQRISKNDLIRKIVEDALNRKTGSAASGKQSAKSSTTSAAPAARKLAAHV